MPHIAKLQPLYQSHLVNLARRGGTDAASSFFLHLLQLIIVLLLRQRKLSLPFGLLLPVPQVLLEVFDAAYEGSIYQLFPCKFRQPRPIFLGVLLRRRSAFILHLLPACRMTYCLRQQHMTVGV